MSSKILVLDIDSTLVHSSQDMDAYKKLANDPRLKGRLYTITTVDVMGGNDGEITYMWGVFRPYLKEFLDFAGEHFESVYVWSAGRERYVEKMTEAIFKGTKSNPKIVWSWNSCVKRPYVHKPLSNLLDITGDRLEDVFIVDDREETFSKNPGNGILIPAYEPSSNYFSILKDDVSLLQLMSWFSLPQVKNSYDLRTLDKSNIFNINISQYASYLEKIILNKINE